MVGPFLCILMVHHHFDSCQEGMGVSILTSNQLDEELKLRLPKTNSPKFLILRAFNSESCKPSVLEQEKLFTEKIGLLFWFICLFIYFFAIRVVILMLFIYDGRRSTFVWSNWIWWHWRRYFKWFLFFFWLSVGIRGKCFICVGDGMCSVIGLQHIMTEWPELLSCHIINFIDHISS